MEGDGISRSCAGMWLVDAFVLELRAEAGWDFRILPLLDLSQATVEHAKVMQDDGSVAVARPHG